MLATAANSGGRQQRVEHVCVCGGGGAAQGVSAAPCRGQSCSVLHCPRVYTQSPNRPCVHTLKRKVYVCACVPASTAAAAAMNMPDRRGGSSAPRGAPGSVVVNGRQQADSMGDGRE